jgi:4-methyl-5(b-hydroxyethyl)-thiazole monophosphate biosynthesis
MEERVSGVFRKEDRVVVDGSLVTSRGAGTAGEFAIENYHGCITLPIECMVY